MCYVSVQHAIRKLRMPTLCSESTECIWFIIACEHSFLGTMRKSSIKMYFFYFKAISHVMGYHDGTQNFTINKYEMRILAHFGMISPPFFKPISVGYVWYRQLKKKKIAISLYIRQKVNYIYLRDKFSEHQIKQNNAK